nr:MAG: p-hydroxycinnamoyl-CoA synthetase [Actinomycetota bacterium]
MEIDGLGHWLHRRRLRQPHTLAVICGDVTLTYGDLADAVDRTAGALASMGVRKGDRVAMLGENSPEFIQVMFACFHLGAVYVPINTRLAPPEVQHVLDDSGAKVLVHDTELAQRADAALALTRRAAEITVLAIGGAQLGKTDFAQTVAAAEPRLAFEPVSIEDPAAIIYTSGTTGTAKGAVLSHRNLTFVAINTIIDYDVVSDDVALMISPLFHVASLGMGALPCILKGATLVVERRFDPGRALALIEKHGVTMMSGVPTTYQLIADHPNWDATDLSSLKKLTCGGSAAVPRIIEAYEKRGLRFSQGYGMTETSPGATSLSANMTLEKAGSVGLPHFFSHVRVMREDGTPAAVREVGEIQIIGPNVFSGYLGLEEATRNAFTDDGWYKSGDLGYLDEDGYLFIAGRLKDMIISGGENIYPIEVEARIAALEGVTGVAVIPQPDPDWGEVPVAVLTLADGVEMDLETLRARLDGVVARYKLPKRVIVVDDLPRTASGKVRKFELLDQLQKDGLIPTGG